jgi:hypothetical protein
MLNALYSKTGVCLNCVMMICSDSQVYEETLRTKYESMVHALQEKVKAEQESRMVFSDDSFPFYKNN